VNRTLILMSATAVLATAACSSGSPSAPVTVTVTSTTSSTSTAPATPSASTSMTPSAIAADATQVIKDLAAAGLPVKLTITYTAATDTNHLLGRPNGYDSKAAFADSDVKESQVRDRSKGSVDFGGSVEAFSTPAAALARGTYLQKILAAAPILGSEYDYVSDGTLLRLSGILTPAQAAAFQAPLAQITGQPAAAVKA
jgi:hypothetical protein